MPPTQLPNDQTASSSPAVPRVATSSQNAGKVTSTAPEQNPTGSVAATGVRTPGGCRAPRKCRAGHLGGARKQNPTGSVAATIVRTPGDCSAPRKCRSSRLGVGRNAREGGSDVRASVPMTELTADSPSAGAGDATATIAAVSSGPPTNESS